MTSFLPSLSPINAFPDYHGPYAVGTVDVEIPASDLPSPCETPEGAQPTIAFRIFYPCAKPSKDDSRPVRWIPQPQRLTTAALMRFLGVTDRKASGLSYLAQHLYWIKLRAYRNAEILDPPTSSGRWPVTMFSHGLAGSRNAYSYICGDMASNGMIVVALDHRDGSSPVQYVRATNNTEARVVSTIKISHSASKEVWEARDKQLRIRLWEISMAYQALMEIDAGHKLENLDMNTSSRRKERVEVLLQFAGKLDIHRPGKVSFCGHSFGAATMAQLVKSIYYAGDRPKDARNSLISPNADAAITQQITPESPLFLLDMWCLPLLSPDQAWLREKPLPTYTEDGPQGDSVLSMLSESFHNWQENLDFNKQFVAAPARSPARLLQRQQRQKAHSVPAWARLRDESPSADSGYASHDSQSPDRSDNIDLKQPREESAGPYMFYIEKSQHFNHSDFGILFPWLAKRFTKAEDPERILELNTRAIVEVMRNAGIEVAGDDDSEILDPKSGIAKWNAVPLPTRIDSMDGSATSDVD